MPKRFFFILPFFGLLLSSCGQNSLSLAKVFVYDASDEFIQTFSNALKEKLETKGHEVEVFDAARKQSLQNSQIVAAIEDNSKNPLFVNIVDRLSASVLIEKAESCDTPLLFVNREPLLEDLLHSDWSKKNVYYCGADSDYQGQAQAEIADTLFGGVHSFPQSKYDKNGDGKIQIALFRGELGHQDAEHRSKSSLGSLARLGYRTELVSVTYGNWERKEGYQEMDRLLAHGTSIELLLSNNDAMALGAIDRLLEEVQKDDSSSNALPFRERFFPIIGVDGTSQGIEAVKKETLSGTVLNDASLQTEILSDLYSHFVDGQEMPSYGEAVSKSGNIYRVRGRKIVSEQ
ncbi:MAG TPA: hypothetical protein DCZ41_00985 [Firmicutes bacterium]|nr:hypothetical protein [Bacillota bacterium]